MIRSQLLLGAFALAGVAIVSLPALADGAAAIATANRHAGLAAGSGDIGAVHMHLHHVLNCLVGPGGEGFDAAPGNPCGQTGSAIPQTEDAAMKTKLENAAAEARKGIADDDIDAAKKVAVDLQSELK
jgi:hypothetical protein